MKIKKINDIILNETLSINPKLLKLYGQYYIENVLNELDSMYYDDKLKIQGTIFYINIESELFYIIRDLKNWRKEGWTRIQCDGNNWYPIK